MKKYKTSKKKGPCHAHFLDVLLELELKKLDEEEAKYIANYDKHKVGEYHILFGPSFNQNDQV